MRLFEGRTAVTIGGGTGVGAAVALALAPCQSRSEYSPDRSQARHLIGAARPGGVHKFE